MDLTWIKISVCEKVPSQSGEFNNGFLLDSIKKIILSGNKFFRHVFLSPHISDRYMKEFIIKNVIWDLL